MEEWLPSFARREHTANGLREGTGSPSPKSVCRRRYPSPTTGDPPVRDVRIGVAVDDVHARPRHALRPRLLLDRARALPWNDHLRAARRVRLVRTELGLPRLASVHAASDAADAASVAALACAFHPAVSTPRVCSTASVRHPRRAQRCSAEYRPRRAGSAALGASGDRTCPCQRGACRKTRKLPRFERGVPRVPRGARSGRRRADGTAGSSVARREACAGSRARRIVAATHGSGGASTTRFRKQAFFFICHMAKFTLPARRVTRSNHRRVWSSGFRRSSEARRLNSLSCFADFSSPYPWTTGLSAPGRRERARRARYEDDGRLHPL